MNDQATDSLQPVVPAVGSGGQGVQRAVPAGVAVWERRLASTMEGLRKIDAEIDALERRQRWLEAKKAVLTHRIYTAKTATGGNAEVSDRRAQTPKPTEDADGGSIL